jgi:hypothetical protein
LNLINTISKKRTQISNFIKIRRVGIELFYADGRTDVPADRQTGMTKLIVTFLNFANALGNGDGIVNIKHIPLCIHPLKLARSRTTEGTGVLCVVRIGYDMTGVIT